MVLNIHIHVKVVLETMQELRAFILYLKENIRTLRPLESIHEVIAGIDQYIRWYNDERISLVNF